MINTTSRIKNLSIALEAVSRINYEGSADLFDRIQQLLANEIMKQQEDNQLQTAKTMTTLGDDEIPF